jgi:peptide/nickel transport system substrate-binding protein
MHPNDSGPGESGPGAPRLLSRRGLLKMSLVGGGALNVGPGLLAACGSDGTGSSGGSSTPPGTTTASGGGGGGSSSAAAPASSSSGGGGGTGGGGGGGEITVGVVTDMANFDPYYNGTVNFIHMQNLAEFLIDYDDKLTPKPAALTKWELNDDNTKITLTLRENVKLQTGKVWTADDLVDGFKRAADPDQGQQLNGPMAIVKDYKKTGDYEVELTFNSPVAELLVTDLLESFPIVDKDKNNSDYLATKPASGGPFQLESRDPANNLVITRWPDYWNASAVSLDKATFRIFDNDDSMVSALQAGEMDVIYSFPARHAVQLKDQFTIIEGYPGALVDCVRINLNTPPFDNIKLRQAIARSVDRQRIIDEVYFGYGDPCFLPWGPNSPANDPAYEQKNSYDLDEAKKLLDESGAPKTAEALADGSNSDALQMLQILQQSLKQIGFDLKINTLEAQAFRQKLLAGEFGLLFGGIGNSSKSPSRVATNSIYRTVDNPVLKDKTPKAYIDAIAASESATTDEAAKAAYAQLNEVLSTECFAIPVCTHITLTACKKNITGITRDVDDRLVLEGAKVG